MTIGNFIMVLEEDRKLTSEGYGTPKDQFEKKRQELRESYQDWLLCLEWLHCQKLECKEKADELRDIIQKQYKLDRPIHRGTLILAANYEAFVVEDIKGSKDVLIWLQPWSSTAFY